MSRHKSCEDYPEEGQTGGHTVYMSDTESSEVLGPDGEPVRVARRQPIGFRLKAVKGRT